MKKPTKKPVWERVIDVQLDSQRRICKALDQNYRNDMEYRWLREIKRLLKEAYAKEKK